MSPGRSCLFTPLDSANAIAAGATRVVGPGGADPLSSPGAQSTLRDLALADEIHVSIDLAIAADGRFAGPDTAQTLRKLNYQVEAYRVMRDECLARLKRAESDASIMQWLDSVSRQKIIHDRNTYSHRYTAALVGNASQWLGFLKAGRRSDLESLLSSAVPETEFSQIISLKGGLQ